MVSRNRLVLAAAALLLAACSTTHLMYSSATLAYANATPMLAWYVGDYVDMTGEQEDWVRDRIRRVMSWHRAQELPQYSRLLESLAASAEAGFTEDHVRNAHREIREGYHRFLAQAMPDVADFFLRLEPGQVDQLERKFAADSRKLASETVELSVEKRRARGQRKFVEHTEEWVGKLSAAQKALIAERLTAMPDGEPDRLAERRYRQAETIALIRAKPDRERMIAGLRRLMVDPDSWRSPEFQQRQRERDARLFEMIVALGATLSPGQREHLQRRLRGYARDFTEISASP